MDHGHFSSEGCQCQLKDEVTQRSKVKMTSPFFTIICLSHISAPISLKIIFKKDTVELFIIKQRRGRYLGDINAVGLVIPVVVQHQGTPGFHLLLPRVKVWLNSGEKTFTGLTI